jgi:hypothetical protein
VGIIVFIFTDLFHKNYILLLGNVVNIPEIK